MINSSPRDSWRVTIPRIDPLCRNGMRNGRRIRILVAASSVSIFTLIFLSSATTLCSSFLCLFSTPTILHGAQMQCKGEGGIIGAGGGHKIKSCYGQSPRGEFMIFLTRGVSHAQIFGSIQHGIITKKNKQSTPCWALVGTFIFTWQLAMLMLG